MPTLLRRRMLRRRRSAENVVVTASAEGLSSVVMASAPTSKGPALPVTRPPASDGHRLAVAQADPAAEEQDRSRARARWPDAAEIEDPLALEKEVALLGKEQAEARQVDLLLVFFDLREVGVDREVRGQPARQAVFRVDAGVRAEIVAERTRAVRSVVSEDAAYGLNSRFIDCAGVSRPTSVAATAICETPLLRTTPARASGSTFRSSISRCAGC